MSRTGWSAIVLGAMALLVCELPILLTTLGLGVVASGLLPSAMMEMIAIGMTVMGMLLLVVYGLSGRKSER